MQDLALITGVDIPFPEAQLSIHQPTLEEIGFIGTQLFFLGSELLNFSKEKFLNEQDRIVLKDKTNFEVFMSVMVDRNNIQELIQSRQGVLLVLTLIFPNCNIQFTNKGIQITEENSEEHHYINNSNFEQFKQIISEMLCLKEFQSGEEYNPAGERARYIAEKLKKGRQKAAATKKEDRGASLFNRYLSILAIGLQIDINVLKKYTVYQLLDQFKRFELKMTYDAYLDAKLAGATNLDKVEQWMTDIHTDKKEE